MRGKPRKLAAATSSVSVLRIGVRVTWWIPSRRVCAKLPVAFEGEENRIDRRTRMTRVKEPVFVRKQTPVPTLASRRPAMTGPIARDRLNWSELRATALAIRSRETRVGSTAW
jgi:hypothetical protein